jgi:non-homologous end joining protein Ku
MKAWGRRAIFSIKAEQRESEDAAVAAATRARPCGENVVDLMDVLRQSLG